MESGGNSPPVSSSQQSVEATYLPYLWSLTCLTCGVLTALPGLSPGAGYKLSTALSNSQFIPGAPRGNSQFLPPVSSSQVPQQPTATSQPTSPSSHQPIPPSSLQRRREDPSPSTPHQPLPPPSPKPPNSPTVQQLNSSILLDSLSVIVTVTVILHKNSHLALLSAL